MRASGLRRLSQWEAGTSAQPLWLRPDSQHPSLQPREAGFEMLRPEAAPLLRSVKVWEWGCWWLSASIVISARSIPEAITSSSSSGDHHIITSSSHSGDLWWQPLWASWCSWWLWGQVGSLTKYRGHSLSGVSGVVAVNLQYQRMKNAIPEVISKNIKSCHRDNISHSYFSPRLRGQVAGVHWRGGQQDGGGGEGGHPLMPRPAPRLIQGQLCHVYFVYYPSTPPLQL